MMGCSCRIRQAALAFIIFKSITMKKLMQAGFIATLLLFAACREDHSKHQHHGGTGTEQQAAAYQCPMKCEGDKTYDKLGTCPVCKMDLKEVK